MIDLRISDGGDLTVETTGDFALTGRPPYGSDLDEARTVAQLALMAVKTEQGDLLLHPSLGSQLNKILGHQNKKGTAAAGERLIRDAIKSWGVTNKVDVVSWPEDLNTIAYEVRIYVGEQPRTVSFLLKQALDTIPEYGT